MKEYCLLDTHKVNFLSPLGWGCFNAMQFSRQELLTNIADFMMKGFRLSIPQQHFQTCDLMCTSMHVVFYCSLRLTPSLVSTLVSCSWTQFSLSYLTYVIRCNQYSACNHTFDTTCSQWLHHPSFQLSAFCSLVPSLHPPQCILLFVHLLSTLVSKSKNF